MGGRKKRDRIFEPDIRLKGVLRSGRKTGADITCRLERAAAAHTSNANALEVLLKFCEGCRVETSKKGG